MKSFKIKEAFRSIRNGASIKQDKSSVGIPVTRIETISESTIDLEKLGYAGITDDSFKNFYLQEGDILMSHINSVSHLGKVAIFENRSETIIHGMNLLCLKAKKNILYPKYAYYFFRSPIFINSLKPITKKSVNQASFNISSFENIDIVIPEKYAEQIRIATILSKVETVIKQRKESIDLLDELLKSTFLKLFGQGDNSRFQIKLLNEVSNKITDGEHGTVKRFEIGRLYLMARNITKYNELDFKEVSYISEEAHQKIFKRCNPEKGDLLMVCVGATIGKVALVPEMEDFSLARSVALIKPNFKLINPYYLLSFFNSEFGERQIKIGSNEAAQAGLYTGNLKKIEIPVPPLQLQDKFEQISLSINDIKSKCKKSLLELEILFASVSQKAFKGELDLSALQVLVEEEEYQSFTNDRTEPHHFEKNIDLDTLTVKVKPNQFYGGGELLVAGERLANLIKKKYDDKHFCFEMLVNFIKKEKAFDLNKYFSSEEIKANPTYDESEDLKVFLESSVVNIDMDLKQTEKINPWLKLNQHFYNAKIENISLTLTKEDFELIKNRTPEERSGIYFNIVS